MSESEGAEQNALLDAVAEDLRQDARSLARRVRHLAGLSQSSRAADPATGQHRFLELELAGSLRVGQLTATRWLHEADRYLTALPCTLSLLETGELLVHQASVLLQATGHCPAELAHAVESEVLPGAVGLCPSDLRRLVTRTVLRLESEQTDRAAAEQRQAEAAAQRRTITRPEPDGMGLAGAILTAEQLRAWSLGLDTLERAERVADRQAGVARTADQRRADLFAALPAMVLAGGAGPAAAGSTDLGPAIAGTAPVPSASSTAPVPTIVLNIHVPVATVLDLSREPGTLEGYGPVSAEHVRLLRPTAFRRVLVDGLSGRPVAVDDRTTAAAADPAAAREQVLAMLRPEVVTDCAEPQHDPSAHLARLVDLRDVRCAGPGCGSTRNHRDHLDAWPAGPTAAWNLGLVSERCHAAKHNGWTLVRHPDGSTTWTSPLGRTYHRPSPHAAPPRVDLFAEPSPLRPPPDIAAPWWASDAPLTPPMPDESEPGPQPPDDPPF